VWGERRRVEGRSVTEKSGRGTVLCGQVRGQG
jgi:hypothetical protein